MGQDDDILLSEVIGALSYALDLTEGQPMGHSARSCLIGMRLAEALELPQAERSSLFYALLMKDAGCSSNAARLSALFAGDDLAIKREFKLVNPDRRLEMTRQLVRHVAPDAALLTRARQLTRIAKEPDSTRRLVEIRCERGAEIARMIGLSEPAARAIHALDERWDGEGHPYGRAGEEVPLLGRILSLAQSVEVFHDAYGREAAYEMANARSGTWFDPALVGLLDAFASDEGFWSTLTDPDPAQLLSRQEAASATVRVDEIRMSLIAEGFARVIDAKSPYTFRHSEGVAEIAEGIATALGFASPDLTDLRRAALLHDIGKLGVSNRILDKPGKLTDEEWVLMRLHPEYTWRILRRVPGFVSVAAVAASHHERMDGRGYHRGVDAGELPLAARVLAVADVCEALTADRPYRAGMPIERAFEIIVSDVGTALCPVAVNGLRQWLSLGSREWQLQAA